MACFNFSVSIRLNIEYKAFFSPCKVYIRNILFIEDIRRMKLAE